jgi:hypothetical protein
MSALFNVNLRTGECVEEIELDSWSEKTLEEQVAEMRAAAAGLTDARLSAETSSFSDGQARGRA